MGNTSSADQDAMKNLNCKLANIETYFTNFF